MSDQCKNHQDVMNRVHDRIDNVSKDVVDIKTLQSSIQTDVTWIKKNIENALESKRWLIGTALAVLAILISIFK